MTPVNDPQGSIARAKSDSQHLADIAEEALLSVERLVKDFCARAGESKNGKLRAFIRVSSELGSCARRLEDLATESRANVD